MIASLDGFEQFLGDLFVEVSRQTLIVPECEIMHIHSFVTVLINSDVVIGEHVVVVEYIVVVVEYVGRIQGQLAWVSFVTTILTPHSMLSPSNVG